MLKPDYTFLVGAREEEKETSEGASQKERYDGDFIQSRVRLWYSFHCPDEWIHTTSSKEDFEKKIVPILKKIMDNRSKEIDIYKEFKDPIDKNMLP